MKRFGEIMSLALAVVISAGIFTGCGDKKTTDVADASTVQSTVQSTKDEAPITINWMPQNDAQLNMDSPVIFPVGALYGTKRLRGLPKAPPRWLFFSSVKNFSTIFDICRDRARHLQFDSPELTPLSHRGPYIYHIYII